MRGPGRRTRSEGRRTKRPSRTAVSSSARAPDEVAEERALWDGDEEAGVREGADDGLAGHARLGALDLGEHRVPELARARRFADEEAELDRPPQDVVHGSVRLDVEASAALAPYKRDVDRVRAGSGDDEVGLEADDLAYVDLAGRADDLADLPGRAYARRNADEAAADPECAQELGRACVDGRDALRRLLDDGRLVSGALHRHGVGLRHLSERLAPLPAAGRREH